MHWGDVHTQNSHSIDCSAVVQETEDLRRFYSVSSGIGIWDSDLKEFYVSRTGEAIPGRGKDG